MKNSSLTSVRYKNFDMLKAICSFMVVCIHVTFIETENYAYFLTLTRVAVPIFLIISGFLYKSNINVQKKQIKKILVLFLQSNLIFFVYSLLKSIFVNGTISLFLKELINPINYLKMILLNNTFLGYHLWYISAFLYVLIIYYFVGKFKLEKLVFRIIPILLCGDLILGKYSLVILGLEFPESLVRNFLFVGIPYFSIGRFMYIMKDKIYKIPRKFLLFASVFFCITTFLERYILEYIHLNSVRDHYISTTFLSVAIILIAIRYEGISVSDGKIGSCLAEIGKKYSTYIYILHPIFIFILYQLLVVYKALYYFIPVLAYCSTLLFLYLKSNWKHIFKK